MAPRVQPPGLEPLENAATGDVWRSSMVSDVAWMNLRGEITALEAGTLKREIADLILSRPADCLVLNLSRVNYIDSAGLSVLLSANKGMRRIGGKVKLYGLQPRVAAVLEVTRLSEMFEVCEDPPPAVAS